MYLLIGEMMRMGIDYPAVTSMNVSGQPEITDQAEAVAFCERLGVPIFLADPKDRGIAQGSYPILGVDREGVRLLRDGHLPRPVLEYPLGMPIAHGHADTARFPQVAFPHGLVSGLSPTAGRVAMLCWLHGHEEGCIRRTVERLYASNIPGPIGVA